MMRLSRRILGTSVVALALLAPHASACPNCKEAVSEQSNAQDLKSGYYYSIIFMIGMPATMLGAGIFTITRLAKKGLLPEM